MIKKIRTLPCKETPGRDEGENHVISLHERQCDLSAIRDFEAKTGRSKRKTPPSESHLRDLNEGPKPV